MKEMVERVVNTLSEKRPQLMDLERKAHDKVSDFVAELLSKRAGQLAKFGNTEPQA